MTEIFLNPGFEDWTAGDPDNWTKTVGGACTITQETALYQSGASSLKMITDATPGTCDIYQDVTLLANRKYTLSLWRAHIEAGKSTKVMIRDSASNVWLYYDSVNDEWLWDTVARWISIPNTEDMDQYFIGFTTHPSYTAYRIYFARGDDATSTTLWLDDVSLYLDEDDDSADDKPVTVSDSGQSSVGQTGSVPVPQTALVINNCDELTEFSVPTYIIWFIDGDIEPTPGDILTDSVTGATMVLEYTVLTGGSWAANNAAGGFYGKDRVGNFTIGQMLVGGIARVNGVNDGNMSIALVTDGSQAEGQGFIRVTIGAARTCYVQCTKSGGEKLNLAGNKSLSIYAKSATAGKYLILGFGETRNLEQSSGALALPILSTWSKHRWDITAIADASRDEVTIINMGGIASGGVAIDVDFDLLLADGDPAVIEAPLNEGKVRLYPQVHNLQTYEREFAGDGIDGDYVISADTTLPAGSGGIKVVRYNNLTIDATKYLTANAADKVLVILVKGTLTINGTIKMDSRGGAGGILGNRAGKAGVFGGGGGGGSSTAGFVDGSGGGGAGQDGQSGAADTLGRGAGQQLNTVADPKHYPWNKGGHCKGYGGNGTSGVGTGEVGYSLMDNPQTPIPFALVRYLWGAGGGMGAGASGGGGGTGGGIIWIEAKNIVWGANGQVICTGANGASGVGAAHGGGGGGGGGAVLVHYETSNEVAGAADLQSPGGSGGVAGGGSSGAGGAGVDGITGYFQVG